VRIGKQGIVAGASLKSAFERNYRVHEKEADVDALEPIPLLSPKPKSPRVREFLPTEPTAEHDVQPAGNARIAAVRESLRTPAPKTSDDRLEVSAGQESSSKKSVLFYVAGGDREKATAFEAAQLLLAGVISPETMIWSQGLPNWTALRDCASSFCHLEDALCGKSPVLGGGRAPHVLARSANPDYPERALVADDEVWWEVSVAQYSPGDYTATSVMVNDSSRQTTGWADPAQIKAIPGLKDRVSFDGPLKFDDQHFPQNPRGRTGLRGRGSLPLWGPNVEALSVVTRKHPAMDTVQVAVLRWPGSAEWALPGGLVTFGESITGTLRKDFQNRSNPTEMIDALFAAEQQTIVRRDYLDDRRNTDSAWVEILVSHQHCPAEIAERLVLTAGADGSEIKWLNTDTLADVMASHCEFITEAIKPQAAECAAEKLQSAGGNREATAGAVPVAQGKLQKSSSNPAAVLESAGLAACLPKFEAAGVETFEDLRYLTDADLKDIGLNTVQVRRLQERLKEVAADGDDGVKYALAATAAAPIAQANVSAQNGVPAGSSKDTEAPSGEIVNHAVVESALVPTRERPPVVSEVKLTDMASAEASAAASVTSADRSGETIAKVAMPTTQSKYELTTAVFAEAKVTAKNNLLETLLGDHDGSADLVLEALAASQPKEELATAAKAKEEEEEAAAAAANAAAAKAKEEEEEAAAAAANAAAAKAKEEEEAAAAAAAALQIAEEEVATAAAAVKLAEEEEKEAAAVPKPAASAAVSPEWSPKAADTTPAVAATKTKKADTSDSSDSDSDSSNSDSSDSDSSDSSDSDSSDSDSSDDEDSLYKSKGKSKRKKKQKKAP